MVRLQKIMSCHQSLPDAATAADDDDVANPNFGASADDVADNDGDNNDNVVWSWMKAIAAPPVAAAMAPLVAAVVAAQPLVPVNDTHETPRPQ